MPPSTSTSTSPPPSITHLAASSAGSPLYSLPDLNGSGRWERTLARLIDPADSSCGGVPIAVDIEFHSRRRTSPAREGGAALAAAAAAAAAAARRPAARRGGGAGAGAGDDLAYELHYVLDGRGRLSSRPLDGKGRGPRVATGDSVATFAGRAALRPVGGGGNLKRGPKNGTAPAEGVVPWWSLATLTVTMPRDASAEAAEAAVRAAAARLRGARRAERGAGGGGAGTLSAADAAAAVSGARSRSLRGGGGGRGAGGSGDSDASPSSCCSGKKTPKQKKKQGEGKKQTRQQQQPSPPSPSPPTLPPPPSSSPRPASTTLRRRRPLSRRLASLPAFRLKDQTNRLAVAFDPFSQRNVAFTAGVEVFLPGHITPRHSHARGVHELFFVLSGSGVGVAQEARRESEEEEEEEDDGEGGERKGGSRKFRSFPLSPGDAAVFLPMQLHAVDVSSDSISPLVCLEVMAPDDRFAERVMGEGESTGGLTAEELCALAAVGCGSGS